MKGLCLLSVALALLAPASALASAIDREAFTITNYDLNLHLEPQQQRLGVRGQLTLRNDSAQPQRLVALQISSGLTWGSIRVVQSSESLSSSSSPADSQDFGQAVQFVRQPFTSDIDHTGELSEAIVTLPSAIAPKGSVVLAVSYEGTILLDATRLTRIGTPGRAARSSDWDQISPLFTAVRGVGYVVWYPVAMESQNLSEGASMFAALGKWKARHADSQMELRGELVVGGSPTGVSSANDSATSEADKRSANQSEFLVNGKGCTTVEDPAGGFVVLSECTFEGLGWADPAFVVGDFQEIAAGRVRVHVTTQDLGAGQEFAKLEERAEYLVQDWFGPAKGSLEVIDLADANAAPFEAGKWLLVPLAKSSSLMEQSLLLHQLTHTALESPRLWIYEGAAHFAQVLAAEKDGREAALATLAPHRAALAQAERQPGEALVAATQEVFYRSKAALVWWMLRDMMGDAALKRALRAYKAGDDTDVTYLQHLTEAESKRDLGWFFHDWVYTDAGLPTLAAESANARHTTGTNFITAVTVSNSGGAGAEVPVTVHTAGGDFLQRVEVRAKSKAVIRVATPYEPLEVVVNDGSVPESGASEHRLRIGKDESL